MQPIASGAGSIRDIAVLCAGAFATGASVLLALPHAVSIAIGVATVTYTAIALLSRHPRRPSDSTPSNASRRAALGAPDDHVLSSSNSAGAPPGASISDLHRAANASDDLLLVFSAGGPIASANAAANEFFGAGGIGVVGRSLEDLLPQTEIHELYEAARSGQRRECEVAITGRDGRRIFRAVGSPLPVGAVDSTVLLLLRDVTAYQSALRLGGEFVASISHELRTPLASIKAALETLEHAVHDDPQMTQRLLSMIETNVDRLEALTADVLRLSQLESSGQAPDLAELEVKPALESIGVLLDPLFSERKLGLEFDIAPELRFIRTDPRLFELIFKNLTENAGKFAFENSSIRIAARPGDTPDSSRWRVIDRGVGIPIHHQPRIFDRFYQVDSARTGAPKRRGTGLGLAIVQNAVRALGGTIRVESVWQQGTTMIVDLPNCRTFSSPSHPNSTEAASS